VNGPGENKPQIHLVPDYIEDIARVMEHGAEKRGANNWLTAGYDPTIFLDACLRHAIDMARGNLMDPDSGLPHAAHLASDAMIFGVLTRDRKVTGIDWNKIVGSRSKAFNENHPMADAA
jgi:hypothetical protein